MKAWSSYPVRFEINTWVGVRAPRSEYQSPVNLAAVNHNGPRAAAPFPGEKERTAVLAVLTLPGPANPMTAGGIEMRDSRLHVDLASWNYQLFQVRAL